MKPVEHMTLHTVSPADGIALWNMGVAFIAGVAPDHAVRLWRRSRENEQ